MEDFEVARNNYFFDLIIGGHSHLMVDTTLNNIPVFQSGSYLNHLGKISLQIQNRSIESVDFKLINLDKFTQKDEELQALINEYNSWPELNEIIGYSSFDHSSFQTGCFYTDALRNQLNVDVTFQNTGGVRAGLEKGGITKRDIYEIDPFNNGTMIYEMTVLEIKNFLKGSGSGFYYSGIQIGKNGSEVVIRDLNNHEIPDDYVLKVGLSDYIPAVHELYFPETGIAQAKTSAETIISYLENYDGEINYKQCSYYFRY
jgi:2',3'-cyclic-nucleotide 2'-phosphodiesterase (5'-nucleotidase family)